MMKKNAIINLMLIILFFSSFFGRTQIPPSDPSYTLMLYDNFDTLVTSNRWEVLNSVYTQNYAPCYKSANVSINSNVNATGISALDIALQSESYTCDYYYGGSPITRPYTSGEVRLKSNYYFKYGYMEANIKIPYVADSRMWPAFWTKIGEGLTGPPWNQTFWYSVSEIDIMEEVQITNTVTPGEVYQDDKILGCGVWYYYGAICGTGSNTYAIPNGTFYPNGDYFQVPITSYTSGATGFHKFAAEWSPLKITWYYDDIPVKTLINLPRSATTNTYNGAACNYAGGGIHDLSRVIFDLSYQGNETINTARHMYVDYVKIYQLQPDCSTNVIQTTSGNYNFTGYDSKVKGYIDIGGSGVTVSWPSSPTMSLRADQYVQLGEGFETPSNATIFIDVPGCPQ